MWDASLTQALRGRVGVPDSNAPLGFRLPVVDMLPIANEQKRLLAQLPARSPGSHSHSGRRTASLQTIHPLLDEDIARLTAGGAIFPRHLLAAAAEVFATRTLEVPQTQVPKEVVATPAEAAPVVVTTPPPVSAPATEETAPVAVRVVEETKDAPVAASASLPAPLPSSPSIPPPPTASVIATQTPLAEKIDALLRQAVDTAKKDTSAASAIDLGERARDLIELMVAPPVTISEGDIPKSYDNFDGTDRWFEWGGGKVRIVTSDAMRGSLIAVLERLQDASGDTLLLRHAVAPVSGQLTMELLNTFKAKNTFHHTAGSESAVLAALGHVLAAQREGSYDQLATEPPATKDNVLAALRNHPLLRGLRLWELIQKLHAPKQAPQTPPPPSVLASIVNPAAKPSAASVVKPPPVPGAKPPPPPLPSTAAAKPASSVVVTKPVARPPAPPTARPPVAKPPTGVPRPPSAKLPPPSQGTAA
jgi:hypothetical protein